MADEITKPNEPQPQQPQGSGIEQPQQPSPEEGEYTKERFDGLMSSWQEDRRRMLELEKELRESQQQTPPEQNNPMDAWLDWLEGEQEKRKTRKEEEEDAEIEDELEEVSTEFPNLDPDEILEVAIRYSPDRGEAISLHQAAEILLAIKSGQFIREEELGRKEKTGTMGGKPGVPETPGMKPYEPSKEGRKSYQQLIEEGKKELGL